MGKDIKAGFELGLDEVEASSEKETQAPKKRGKKADFEVGYGRPPKDKQFKPGKSGNPKGRPKHATTFMEALNRKMGSFITVTENGVKKKKTTLEVIVQKYINQALSGNDPLLSLFIRENAKDVRIENILYPRELKPEPTPEEQAKMDELLKAMYDTLNERHRD